MNHKYKKSKGFSLAELLVVLVISGILFSAAMPLVTIRKKVKNFDLDTITCIKSELASNLTSLACSKTISNCKYEISKACNTLKYMAYHGKNNTGEDEQTASRKVLREACDQGGSEACKFFVESCRKDSENCDISGSNYDLHYYLMLGVSGNELGKLKIKDQVNSYYLANNTNVKNAVDQACSTHNGETACNHIAEECTLKYNTTACLSLISSCNNGALSACKLAYIHDINKTCKTIRDISRSTATSGIYKITILGWDTTDGDPTNDPFNVYCDMTTDDDAGDSEPAGGWTLVMKQKSGDGETLQGDNSYWTDENYGTLNDADSNLNENDENLVSKAFTAVPVSDRLMLKAGNEAEVRTEIQAYSHAFNAFQSPVQYSDDVNGINPDWFIQATTYPNTQTITSARFEIKHEQIRVIKTPGRLMCAVRWGWTANQDPIGDDQGSHDSCGGLGAYGYMYGSAWMNNDKNIWQPATLYLYVK